jgi:hypothetical protein
MGRGHPKDPKSTLSNTKDTADKLESVMPTNYAEGAG